MSAPRRRAPVRSALLAGLLLAAGCGPVERDPACAAYVRCVKARDGVHGLTTDVTSYSEDGACWQNADNAALCTTACRNGLDWLRATDAQLPAHCDERS